MKNTIKTAALVTSAALAHILPAFALVVIATGGETADALGAALLLMSSLALGYIHGVNRSLSHF